MNEREITEDQVRDEHLAEVKQWHQWAYLAAVISGGLALMVAYIAALGSAG
jgi:hypothetical protein